MPVSWGQKTFSALRIRNFRLFMIGQAISQSGTWMQTIAIAVLVLQIIGRGAAVGLVFSLQFLPMLVFTTFGGVVADRIADKRRALCITQSTAGALALILGLLVLTGTVQLWMVYVLATALGIVNAIDNPIRQTFVYMMVGADDVNNAVSINAILVNLARVFGPALGGVLIATLGLSTCFLYNAGSYGAVVLGLVLIRSGELHTQSQPTGENGRIRDGLRYMRSTPAILVPLLMVALMGTLTWEFQVSFPLVAKFTFHEGAGMLSAMMTILSIGGIAGGFVIARRDHASSSMLCLATGFYALTMFLAALAPNVALELLAMAPLGMAAVMTMAIIQSTLQLTTSTQMRGRVMAVWATALQGSTAIGGPIIGWTGDHLGPRYGLVAGGVAAFAAATLGYFTLARTPGTTIGEAIPQIAG